MSESRVRRPARPICCRYVAISLIGCRVQRLTNEASDTTWGESQHNDDIERADVNTELECVCRNYPEQLAGKCFTFNPATILNSIRL